jgi:hypothetical protein
VKTNNLNTTINNKKNSKRSTLEIKLTKLDDIISLRDEKKLKLVPTQKNPQKI